LLSAKGTWCSNKYSHPSFLLWCNCCLQDIRRPLALQNFSRPNNAPGPWKLPRPAPYSRYGSARSNSPDKIPPCVHPLSSVPHPTRASARILSNGGKKAEPERESMRDRQSESNTRRKNVRLSPGIAARAAVPFPFFRLRVFQRLPLEENRRKAADAACRQSRHAPKKCKHFFGKLHCAPRTRSTRTVRSVKSVLSDAHVAGKNRFYFISPYRRRNSARRYACTCIPFFNFVVCLQTETAAKRRMQSLQRRRVTVPPPGTSCPTASGSPS